MDDIIKLKIEDLGASADGVAIVDDKKYYVPFSLAGEEVLVEKTNNRKKPNHYKLIDLQKKAKNRIEPFCDKFAKCGGCSIQHLEVDSYKAWKSNILAVALKYQNIDTSLNPLKIVEQGSRRRISISYENFKGNIEFGFYEKFSRRIVDIENCPLLIKDLNDLLIPIRELLKEITTPRDSGHFMISKTDIGIDLAFCPRKKPDLSTVSQYFVEFANKHDIARITRAGKELIIERYKPQVQFAKTYIDFPSGAFLQPSKAGELLLLAEIIGKIKKHNLKTKKILDLCCGLGTFSLPLSEYGFVKAIDVFGASITSLKSHSNIGLEVEERNLFTNPLVKHEIDGFDLAVINPPRCGADQQVTNLAASKISNVIYISCDVKTFAHDAKIMLNNGYQLLEVTPVDQFPYTNHLEVVGHFSCEKK